MTYPDAGVSAYITHHFVPVQLNVVEQPEVIERFHAPWTPTIIVQDANGTEHRRSSGYLDPRRFLGEVSLARLQAAIDRKDLAGAEQLAGEARRTTEGDPEREPEALYWSSVAAYKATHQADSLLAGWNKLLDEFPDSDWARKAEFIRYP